MPSPYVTGSAILSFLGIGSPTADQTTWAGQCADAVDAAIVTRLDGYTLTADGEDEMEVAALTDGAMLFKSKASPFGILSYGPDQETVRIGSDALRTVLPVIYRQHSTAGIGIA